MGKCDPVGKEEVMDLTLCYEISTVTKMGISPLSEYFGQHRWLKQVFEGKDNNWI